MVMLRLNPEWQADNKFSSLAIFCLNLDSSAHHIHNVLGNSHAKSGTLSPGDRGSPLPLKRRKELLYKFLAHTDSVILYPDLVQRTAALRPRTLFEPD